MRIYKGVIRPVITYEAETMCMTKEQETNTTRVEYCGLVIYVSRGMKEVKELKPDSLRRGRPSVRWCDLVLTQLKKMGVVNEKEWISVNKLTGEG